ncbi:MAG: preprotein translocase subunit YajC [Nocardioidaceae bacterium]
MKPLVNLLFLVGLLALVYLLLIRPARRRARDQAQLQQSLSPGDEVMLTSGIFGSVVMVDDERMQVEVAPGTVLSVHPGAVGKRVGDLPPPTPADVDGGATAFDDGSPVDASPPISHPDESEGAS